MRSMTQQRGHDYTLTISAASDCLRVGVRVGVAVRVRVRVRAPPTASHRYVLYALQVCSNSAVTLHGVTTITHGRTVVSVCCRQIGR